MPLIQATALAQAGGKLFAGTNTGEVHVYDSHTREPITLLTSERKTVVSAIAAGKEGTAWIVGSKPMAIRGLPPEPDGHGGSAAPLLVNYRHLLIGARCWAGAVNACAKETAVA